MKLVELDIETVEKSRFTLYPPEISATLRGYLATLSPIVKLYGEQDEKAADQLSSLSTKELKSKALELLEEL